MEAVLLKAELFWTDHNVQTTDFRVHGKIAYPEQRSSCFLRNRSARIAYLRGGGGGGGREVGGVRKALGGGGGGGGCGKCELSGKLWVSASLVW